MYLYWRNGWIYFYTNNNTEAEFELRIEGGQTATAQIDRVSLSVSDTLNAGDQISVVIDGHNFY